MSITPLGAGQEVGRSCHVLEFRGLTIMLDIGIHPGYDGLNGLPFLDRVEPDQIDVLLVTHFHLDHAASLPYLTERTGFKGRIFMTHPTKAVLRLLLGDYLRLLSMRNAKAEDVLYTELDLQRCLEKVELIDYHTTVTLPGGLSFYALNAGHVLGACMFWIDVGGRSLLYTGDYSMEEDRHLMAAEVPHDQRKPDVLITESTFGVQVHASRAEREARFTTTIERVVTRGGRCLIPVFALGRAQVRVSMCVCVFLCVCSLGVGLFSSNAIASLHFSLCTHAHVTGTLAHLGRILASQPALAKHPHLVREQDGVSGTAGVPNVRQHVQRTDPISNGCCQSICLSIHSQSQID